MTVFLKTSLEEKLGKKIFRKTDPKILGIMSRKKFKLVDVIRDFFKICCSQLIEACLNWILNSKPKFGFTSCEILL